MPISEQFVQEAGEALLNRAPLVSADMDASQQVRAKILSFVEKMGYEPSAKLVCRFAEPLEAQLHAQREAEEAEARREAERQARIDRDFHRPSSEDKQEAIEEFRSRQPQPVAREPFQPKIAYSEEEIERMDSETYRREILGDSSRVEDKNPSYGRPIEPKKAQTIVRRAYDSRRAQEERDRTVRQKQISLDEQQKSKLRKDLKAALTGGK